MIHACFYGGGSGSRVTRSVGVIRDLTKTMKAMTLKVKRGERHARARRRRRRAKAEDDADLDHQDNDAPSSASSSAKIAPAQPHEEEEHGASEKTKRRHCDKCCSPLEDDDDHVAAAAAEEEEKEQGGSDGEWMAEPEPGVLMTLAPRGDGANYLRRIRFGEEHFPDARAARAWWEENFDRIVELYSVVVQPEHGDEDDDDCCDDPAAPVTPCQSEDDEQQRPDGELEYSASCSASGGSTSNFSGPSSGSGSGNKADSPILGLVTEPNSSKRSKPSRRNQKTGQEQ